MKPRREERRRQRDEAMWHFPALCGGGNKARQTSADHEILVLGQLDKRVTLDFDISSQMRHSFPNIGAVLLKKLTKIHAHTSCIEMPLLRPRHVPWRHHHTNRVSSLRHCFSKCEHGLNVTTRAESSHKKTHVSC